MRKMYATVGKWDSKPGNKGLSIMSYDAQKGAMEIIDTVFEEITSGSQCMRPDMGILYVCDEREDRDGWVGGGGYVLAIKISPADGKASIINRKESLGTAPSYIIMDKSGQYLLVTHHGKQGHATKVFQHLDGSYDSKVIFDDAALVLFRLNSDGSIGNICDVSITQGEGVSGKHTISHQHSITTDPTGKLYFICDKGTDKVYTYHIDRENGKLVFLKEYTVMDGCAPRYAVFHPTIPVVFHNNENKTEINAWRYDIASGELERICTAQLFNTEELAALEPAGIKPNGSCMYGPSDIVITKDGKNLYCSVRKANKIVVLNVDDGGCMTAKQVLDCGGNNPRGLCLSPDGRFLFSANMESGNIARFIINADGGLYYDGLAAENMHIPANMVIMEL